MHSQRFLHDGLQVGHILTFLEGNIMANPALALPLVNLLAQCLEGLWILEHVVEDCREADGGSV
jgi:hypothetical protein